ncbi:hypothetical protein F441_21383 [Phytophthora nicotianae CJ01A1]|uniref:Uncharacterized protein n=2 Tax=Phytophthora nicotianae TaxID=4792 RepID=W2VUG5_PHYNI|nr:hypothetical protein F441_21383 [Phytophthora nicotianae CJ01A1]
MSRVRVSVEWGYGQVVNHWAALDFKRQARSGTQPVDTMYRSLKTPWTPAHLPQDSPRAVIMTKPTSYVATPLDFVHIKRRRTYCDFGTKPVSQTKFCLLPQLPRTFKKKNPNNLNYASPLTSTLSPTQIAFPSFDLERLK